MGYRHWLIISISLVCFSSRANAQRAGEDFGLISHVIPKGDFVPVSASTLLYHPSFGIERLAAKVIETAVDEKEKRYNVATTFRLQRPFVPFYYTIFARDAEGNTRSTPVRRYDERQLGSATVDNTALRTDLVKLEREYTDAADNNSLLKESGVRLRQKLHKFADTDRVIEASTELLLFQRAIEEKEELAPHLKSLARAGRKLDSPENIDSIRKTLSVHLRDAAQVTSAANLLNRRRTEAAEARFRKKLELVKDSKEADASALAKEVIELRKKRRALEAQLLPADDEE